MKKFQKYSNFLLHFVGGCDNIIEPSLRRFRLNGYAAVAQLDRVFGYEPKGRGFESLQPYQKGNCFGSCLFVSTQICRREVPG